MIILHTHKGIGVRNLFDENGKLLPADTICAYNREERLLKDVVSRFLEDFELEDGYIECIQSLILDEIQEKLDLEIGWERKYYDVFVVEGKRGRTPPLPKWQRKGPDDEVPFNIF